MGGCLTKIVLLLGLCAVLFVGACVLGFVKNDPETGAPSLSLEGVKGLENLQLPQIDLDKIALPESLQNAKLPDLSGLAQGVQIPGWAYAVTPAGLTVKTLRAGDGEAVLVCADGYTMLLGGGSGIPDGVLRGLQGQSWGLRSLDSGGGVRIQGQFRGHIQLAHIRFLLLCSKIVSSFYLRRRIR